MKGEVDEGLTAELDASTFPASLTASSNRPFSINASACATSVKGASTWRLFFPTSSVLALVPLALSVTDIPSLLGDARICLVGVLGGSGLRLDRPKGRMRRATDTGSILWAPVAPSTSRPDHERTSVRGSNESGEEERGSWISCTISCVWIEWISIVLL